MKKRMIGIFLACLCIIGMLTSISAVEGEITDLALAAAQAEAELAATYPQCPCGGRGRDFISTSSNTHTVRCRVCKLTIVSSESCTPLMDATCSMAAECMCGNVLGSALGHLQSLVALNESEHGYVCTRSGCPNNPQTPGYAGSISSGAHNISYVYTDYTHNTTGDRWHTKAGTCSVCRYEYESNVRCRNQSSSYCPNRMACFG